MSPLPLYMPSVGSIPLFQIRINISHLNGYERTTRSKELCSQGLSRETSGKSNIT